MAIRTTEAWQFTKNTLPATEISLSELLAMPYDKLYDLHSAITLRKRGSWPSLPKFLGGEDELGFGNLTVDRVPNRTHEAYIHIAPLPTTKIQDDFVYIPANNLEILKFSLITTEDLLRLLDYYSQIEKQKPELVPDVIVGQTHYAIAEVSLGLGFTYRRQHEHNDIEELGGVIRFVEIKRTELQAQKQSLIHKFKRLQRIAFKRNTITPTKIRAEIIYNYLTT